ncbi:MAG: hypothetical protein EOO82_02090 [Oxalobacteraceae bacterium]|nr:MAG: hypothetical protein EOO82_02090 [Oxalobacteraceae bacterium]
MNEITAMHWFAIQTRPRAEAVVELGLRSLGIEPLLPRARRLLRHATRTPKMAVRPLFPGYLFARFCAAERLRAVRFSRGVGVFDRQMNDARRVVILIDTIQQGCVVIPRECVDLSDAS